MKYLVDTSVLIWSLEGDFKALKPFMPILEDTNKSILVSVVSYWEIIIKKALNKLDAPDNLINVIPETGFEWLYLTPHHLSTLEKLPPLHRDPFDRLLIAQSQSEQATMLTSDPIILNYFSK